MTDSDTVTSDTVILPDVSRGTRRLAIPLQSLVHEASVGVTTEGTETDSDVSRETGRRASHLVVSITI